MSAMVEVTQLRHLLADLADRADALRRYL